MNIYLKENESMERCTDYEETPIDASQR